MSLESVVLDMIENTRRTNSSSNVLNLGGASGPGGGVGGPPAGFVGKLPQSRIAYDETEAEDSSTPSGTSLVTNLNHIRARIDGLETVVFGSMYADDMDVTVDVVAMDTYYAVPSGLSAGEVEGFTFQNDSELVCTASGIYKTDWSMTVACVSPNQHIEGGVMVGTTVKLNTVSATKTQNANDPQSIGGTGLIRLAPNDVVKLCIENETSSGDVHVDHANLTIVRIRS